MSQCSAVSSSGQQCILEACHGSKHRIPRPHPCHWPDCDIEVSPKMWGCDEHWRSLPTYLRNLVHANYVPGQEITENPTKEYMRVMGLIDEWLSYTPEPKTLPQSQTNEEWLADWLAQDLKLKQEAEGG